MAGGSQFTEEFKREAVCKAEVSQNVSRTAGELGISTKTLYEWIKQFGQPTVLDVNTATVSELSERIRELERAVAHHNAHRRLRWDGSIPLPTRYSLVHS